MPREVIQRSRRVRTMVTPDGSIPTEAEAQWRQSEGPLMQVSWSNNHGGGDGSGWVSVQLVTTKGVIEQTLKDTADSVVTLHSETMTRDEINQAIRMLKRARDAAYGRDE